MIINWILAEGKAWRAFFFHVLMGLGGLLSSWVLIGYFFLVVLTSLSAFSDQKKTNNSSVFFFAYLLSFEVFARMLGTSPFIPYELSKYLMFFMGLLALVKGLTRGAAGPFLLILLLPALFLGEVEVPFSSILFNLFGAINLALAVWFFSAQQMTSFGLQRLVHLLVLPLVSVLVYTVIRTPQYDEMEFVLGAVHSTTGGFGSNQVSTLFGLGAFLSMVMIVMQWPLSGNRYLDYFSLGLFVFQGLLSFSRGGMIGGLLAMGLFLFTFIRSSKSREDIIRIKKLGRLLSLGIAVLLVGVYFANEITDGLLMRRYRGETYGTIVRNESVSLDGWSTGRVSMLMDDVQVFLSFPFGVGAANSPYYRGMTRGVLTHVELGRLLAEHGFFGAVYFFTLLLLIWGKFRLRPFTTNRGILLAFMVLALYTTFHAAMRTYLTPLLFGLGMLHLKTPVAQGIKTSK